MLQNEYFLSCNHQKVIFMISHCSDLFFGKNWVMFTLVSCNGGHIFSRGGQAEDPSTVDTSFCLYVVFKGAVYSSR